MRVLLCAVPIITAGSFAAAQSPIANERCDALVKQGIDLIRQNKINEALAKFQEAEKADPLASGPLSGRALAFYSASQMTAEENVQKYRNEAERCAKTALQRQPKDLVAQEVLRVLDEGMDKQRHKAAPEAQAAMDAGEDLFQKGQFSAAQNKYEEAIRIDPACADALVYAGDCQFHLGQQPGAESYFRKAILVDPLHERAWRFLADSLIKQGKSDQAEDAVIGAISARPNYIAAWDTLSELWKASGRDLNTFKVKPMVRTVLDEKTKKMNIVVDQSLLSTGKKDEANMDLVGWMAYGMAQVAKRLPPKPGEPQKSPFEIEMEIWETTLKVIDEVAGSTKAKAMDPSLLQMQVFRSSGDLKAALLLLTYKEAYRPEFEAWKKANPNGVKTFLDKFRLRP